MRKLSVEGLEDAVSNEGKIEFKDVRAKIRIKIYKKIPKDMGFCGAIELEVLSKESGLDTLAVGEKVRYFFISAFVISIWKDENWETVEGNMQEFLIFCHRITSSKEYYINANKKIFSLSFENFK